MRYRDKLRLTIVLALALSVGLSGTWLITSSFTASYRREVESAQREQRVALYTLATAAGQMKTPDLENMMDAMTSLASQTEISYRVLDEAGKVLFVRENVVHYEQQQPLANGAAADLMVWRVCEQEGQRCLAVAGVVDTAGGTFYLESLRSIENIYHAREEQCRQFLLLMVFVGGLGFLTAGLLARWLTIPLSQLAETARAVTGGDLSRRAAITGEDEISQLAGDFNTMTERLGENIHALEQTMARQEEFMASFAHEVRTPMTSIIGYADLLRSGRLPEQQRVAAAQYIFSEGRRLQNLSNKLLDLIVLNKQDSGGRVCRMDRLVEEVCRPLQPQLQKDGILLEYQAEETVLHVDPDLVKTLIVNLLDNARKAMPQGGRLSVRAVGQDEGWLMTVQDQGVGMPPEALERLTEAFYRVDKSRSRAQGGTGLGLCLCERIAKFCGGWIQFQSVQGEGTVVTVFLKGGECGAV